MTEQIAQPAATRRMSLDMLLTLPAVFDLKDMETFLGMNRKDAKHTCWRWKGQNFIASAGPQAGIYYNNVKPLDRSARLVRALDKAIRVPYIAIGASALNQAGWTTQIAQIPEVAAPHSRYTHTYPLIDQALIVPRPLSWMKVVWSASAVGLNGLMTAPPEIALVDCIMARAGMFKRSENLWDAPPDDISMSGDDEVEVIRKCYQAASALEAPLDLVRDYLKRVPDLEDYVHEVDVDTHQAQAPSPWI